MLPVYHSKDNQILHNRRLSIQLPTKLYDLLIKRINETTIFTFLPTNYATFASCSDS